MIVVGDRARNLGTLTEQNAEEVHEASLRLLASPGLRVPSKRARKVLATAGGLVRGETVRIPAKLVSESLAACPRNVTLVNCDGSEQPLVPRRMSHSTGCHRLFVLDYGHTRARVSRAVDMERLTRVADALPEIGAVTLMVSAREHRPPISEIHALQALVLHTKKHLYLAPQDLMEARVLLDLAEIVRSSDQQRMPVSLFTSATSPLVIGTEVTGILFEGIARGAVMTLGSCAAAGATSPATLAGTILLQNVETLFLIVLAQHIQPGTPVIYDSGSTVADLRTGTFSLGDVGYAVIRDGAVALANKYQLPFSSTCDTNSPTIDVQNGLQKMLGYFSVMATGASFSKNAGSLANGTIMSLEQLVLDHEIILLVERLFRGVRVDSESLAEEVIQEIGQGGHYLTSPHTLRHCRSDERYVSALLNMQEPGAAGMVERAHEEVTRILSMKGQTVDESVREEVSRYVAKATDDLQRRELG